MVIVFIDFYSRSFFMSVLVLWMNNTTKIKVKLKKIHVTYIHPAAEVLELALWG